MAKCVRRGKTCAILFEDQSKTSIELNDAGCGRCEFLCAHRKRGRKCRLLCGEHVRHQFILSRNHDSRPWQYGHRPTAHHWRLKCDGRCAADRPVIVSTFISARFRCDSFARTLGNHDWTWFHRFLAIGNSAAWFRNRNHSRHAPFFVHELRHGGRWGGRARISYIGDNAKSDARTKHTAKIFTQILSIG